MARMYNPAHPGEVLREFLPEAMTIEDVAGRLGVSRVQLSRILNGRSAVSADMAIRIGLLTRTTPESWLASQAKWDLWQASQKPRPAVQPFQRARRTKSSAKRDIGREILEGIIELKRGL
jgi:antitoxin HigA-1